MLRRSGVHDAEYLIALLEKHVTGEFDPGCGITNQWGGVCAMPVGHDGYHQTEDGHRWMRFGPGPRSDDEG